MAYLIITHLSGSKSNQKEKFPIEGLQTITMGRDPSSDIAYDPEMDDIVSREHAKIEPDPSNPFELTLTDLNSSNGIFVNKIRIHGSILIHHGDLVQLGKNGPEFRFEIDPPPPETIKSTRLAEIPKEFIPKTREATIPSQSSLHDLEDVGEKSRMTSGSAQKSTIGRNTVEQMIITNKKESKKILINVVAALLGVVILVAAFFIYNSTQVKDKTNQQFAQLDEKINIADSQLETMKELKTPRQIADMFSAATVYIEVSWKLIYTPNGSQIYHRYKTYRDKPPKPMYIEHPNGTIEPWLVTDNEDETNDPVGTAHTGSGFVVTETGFIITNRHVAASWLTREPPPLPGLLYRVSPNGSKYEYIKEITEYEGNLHNWVPAKTIFLGGRKIGAKRIEGRLDTLDVTFPKNKLRIPAKLVRISNEHDVALIKIDTPEALTKVEVDDTYKDIRPGDPITIMGYPGVSPKLYVATKSQDLFNPVQDIAEVPAPTVTPGIIGKVIRGVARPLGGEIGDYYSESDSYQLTATATGFGNSGGPVFNGRGQVIGIFYSSRQEQLNDARITFAVPIKFAMDLLRVTPVL